MLSDRPLFRIGVGPDNQVMFTIFLFIPTSTYKTYLTTVLQADIWFWKRTVYR